MAGDNGSTRGAPDAVGSSDRLRLAAFVAMMSLLALMCSVQLYQVSIVKRGLFVQYSESQQETSEQRIRLRGPILDGAGRTIAYSVMTWELSADGRSIRDPRGTAERLHRIVPQLPVDDLVPKLSAKKPYILIAPSISDAAAADLTGLRADGIYVREAERRVYSGPSSLKILVGDTGQAREPLYGIEMWADRYVASRDSLIQYHRAPWKIFDQKVLQPGRDGAALHTFLDLDVQARLDAEVPKLVHTDASIWSAARPGAPWQLLALTVDEGAAEREGAACAGPISEANGLPSALLAHETALAGAQGQDARLFALAAEIRPITAPSCPPAPTFSTEEIELPGCRPDAAGLTFERAVRNWNLRWETVYLAEPRDDQTGTARGVTIRSVERPASGSLDAVAGRLLCPAGTP